MDKRELLQATLAGETTDRVPCAFWHHYPPECHYGSPSVQAHKKFYEATDADIFKVMNEHLYKTDREIFNPGDWRKIRQQKFEDGPYVDFVGEFKEIRKIIPPDVPLFATFHGVFASAFHASDGSVKFPRPDGSDDFSNPDNMVSSHLREDPESVAAGLRVIGDTLIDLAVRLKQAGSDGIYYAALGGESYRFSKEILEKYIIPLDSYVNDALREAGLLTILHICKDKVRIPSYGKINADIVNWAVHDSNNDYGSEYSLAEGRKIFPGKTILGGFDDRSGILVEGTKEEIEAEAGNILQKAGRKQFIFGADCTLPDDIELWRINTVHTRAAAL
jgi:uroporphyrinogen decarboxylase